MTTPTDSVYADGFVAIRGAVAADVVWQCVRLIENELRARGVDPLDPATWTKPVVRFACPEGPAFAAAGTSAALSAVYDELLAPGGWIPPRGVGGTVPVRFPSTTDPGDAGWHIDGSYDVDGRWWVNVQSRGRGLLVLFLFTDVGDQDAPILVHRATWPHLGTRPRMLAQPAIAQHHPFALRDDVPVCTVERAILQGLR